MSISRRGALKGSLVSAASLLLAQPNQIFAANSGRQLSLSAAGYPFNYAEPSMAGKVKVEGCETAFETPSQLKGKRVATPGYSSTSLQWIRGMLQNEYGVRPEDIEWVVSAKDSAAATSGAPSKKIKMCFLTG